MAGRTGAVSVAAADSAGSSTSPQSWRPLATRGRRPGPAESPAVLLLDEPAAGLSDTERAEVARLITVMAREWNIAVILIEHDVSLVRRVADRVIALNFGRPIPSRPARPATCSATRPSSRRTWAKAKRGRKNPRRPRRPGGLFSPTT